MAVLTQLQLDQSIVDCGMSYVFQLDSGRFFLIDGGYFSPGEAERLLGFLKEKCGGKPIVEGWFFSHAHQDHIGVFLDMIENHRDEIEIREMIYTFQPMDLPETSEGWRIESNDLATVKRFCEDVERVCRDIPVRRPHTGDVWRVGELTLEVLYTWEDLEGESNFNDHCTVLRVECRGQVLLFTGDVYYKGSRFLLDHKADRIKCDILQVSHHGYRGGTTELYRATGAKVALWPTPDYRMEEICKNEPTRYLFYESSVREHYVSGFGNVSLRLPYLPGSAEGQAYIPAKRVRDPFPKKA